MDKISENRIIVKLGSGETIIGGAKRSDGGFSLLFSKSDEPLEIGEELGEHKGLLPNTFLEITSDKKESFEVIIEQCYRAIHGKSSDVSALKLKLEEAVDRIKELSAELSHAHVFVQSREKMHPTGICLYEDLMKRTDLFLTSL